MGRTWIVGLVLLAGCTSAASDVVAERSTPSSVVPTPFDGPSAACGSAFYWEHPDCPLPPLVALDDIQPAGVGVDEIPPIDDPVFERVDDADRWLDDDSPMLVVTVGDETKAYPLAILVWHEIVNDVVGGEPVVVTYCPLCNTGIVFERTVDGEVLDFGTSGHLWRSNLVMYDRQHENFWSQVYGRGIAGEPFFGRHLTRVPAQQVGFATLRAAQPDTAVLARDSGARRAYGQNPYQHYERTGPFFPSGPRDDRLAPMDRVIGIGAPDADPVAVTLEHLRVARVIEVETPDGPVVVLWAPGQVSAVDSARIDDGREVGQTGVLRPVTPDGRRLSFTAGRDKVFVDEQTGSSWNVFGRATSGPLAGTQLEPVPHDATFWFAWYAFHSSTRIVDGAL